MRLNIEELKKEYEKRKPHFKRLTETLEKAFRQLLSEEGIQPQFVSSRVKSFDSFWNKVQRKGYTDPFNQTEDFCGLRIVDFLRSDLNRIGSLIAREFEVHNVQDKEDDLDADRFGYRSHHYIISVKPEWLHSPEYRGLGDLRAEVQLRSILMHAWAELSRKFSYTEKNDVPEQLRHINELSAMLENIDNQFDVIKSEKMEYQRSIPRALESGRPIPVNADSLQVKQMNPTLGEGKYTVMLRDDYLDRIPRVSGSSDRDKCIQQAIEEYITLPEEVRDRETEKQTMRILYPEEGTPEYLMLVDLVLIPEELIERLTEIEDPRYRDMDRIINTAIRLWLEKRGVQEVHP